MEEYKIVHSHTPDGLSQIVNHHISIGWKRAGSHQVVTTNMSNRFAGSQIHGSNYEIEYSQTMVKSIDPEMEKFIGE